MKRIRASLSCVDRFYRHVERAQLKSTPPGSLLLPRRLRGSAGDGRRERVRRAGARTRRRRSLGGGARDGRASIRHQASERVRRAACQPAPRRRRTAAAPRRRSEVRRSCGASRPVRSRHPTRALPGADPHRSTATRDGPARPHAADSTCPRRWCRRSRSTQDRARRNRGQRS